MNKSIGTIVYSKPHNLSLHDFLCIKENMQQKAHINTISNKSIMQKFIVIN